KTKTRNRRPGLWRKPGPGRRSGERPPPMAVRLLFGGAGFGTTVVGFAVAEGDTVADAVAAGGGRRLRCRRGQGPARGSPPVSSRCRTTRTNGRFAAPVVTLCAR